MANNDRTYVGSGKAVEGYPLVNISLCVTDIPKEFIKTSEKNGKKYINLTLGENKNGPTEWGSTHSIWINEYEPTEKKVKAPVEDDSPF